MKVFKKCGNCKFFKARRSNSRMGTCDWPYLPPWVNDGMSAGEDSPSSDMKRDEGEDCPCFTFQAKGKQGSSAWSMDRNRPYDGQPHTDDDNGCKQPL